MTTSIFLQVQVQVQVQGLKAVLELQANMAACSWWS